jgi:hypothetical protein
VVVCAIGGSLNGLNTLSLSRDYGIGEFVNAYVYSNRKAVCTRVLRCDDKATIATSHRCLLPGHVNGLPTNISAYHRVGKVKRNTGSVNDCA